MAYGDSRSQYLFVKKETTFGTAVTFGNSDAVRIVSFSTDPQIPDIVRPDKQPYLSPPETIKGRYGPFPWTCSMSLAGSGTPGTKADCDELIAAGFGQDSTVSAGVSVTYGISNSNQYLSIGNYRDPAGLDQELLVSAIVGSMRVEFGGDVPLLNFAGDAFSRVTSATYSAVPTAGKGGLGSVAARPASPVTVGAMAAGFVGAITIDGNAFTTLRTGFIDINWNRELPRRTFNNRFATDAERDNRAVTFELTLDDDDSANLNTIKSKSYSKTRHPLIIAIGDTAGNIWTFTLPSVQCALPPLTDDQRRWGVILRGTAYPTALSALDEISLVLT